MLMTQEELHSRINDLDQVYQNYSNLKSGNERLQRKYHRSLLSLKAARDECQMYKNGCVTAAQHESLVRERDELRSQLSQAKTDHDSFVNDSHIRYQTSCRNLAETNTKYNDLLKKYEELQAENKLVTELCSSSTENEVENLQTQLDEKCKENERLQQKLTNYDGFQTKFAEMLAKNKALSEERESLHLKVQRLESETQRTMETNRLEYASLKVEHSNLLAKIASLDDSYKIVCRERDSVRGEVESLRKQLHQQKGGMETSFKNLMMELRGVVQKYDVRDVEDSRLKPKSDYTDNCDIDNLTNSCTDLCTSEYSPKTVRDDSDSVDEELFKIITQTMRCVNLISPISSPVHDNCTLELNELDSLIERSILEDGDDDSFLKASLLNVYGRRDLLKSSDVIGETSNPVTVDEEFPKLLTTSNLLHECDSSPQSPCEGSLENKANEIDSFSSDSKNVNEDSETKPLPDNVDNVPKQSLELVKYENETIHCEDKETESVHLECDGNMAAASLSSVEKLANSEVEPNILHSDNVDLSSDDVVCNQPEQLELTQTHTCQLETAIGKKETIEIVPLESKGDSIPQSLLVFSPQSTYSETTDSAFYSNCSSSDDDWIDNFVDDLETNSSEFSCTAVSKLPNFCRARQRKTARKKQQKIDNELTLGFDDDKVIVCRAKRNLNISTRTETMKKPVTNKFITKVINSAKGKRSQGQIIIEQLWCAACAGHNLLRKKRKRSFVSKLCASAAAVADEDSPIDLKRIRIEHSSSNMESNKRPLGEGKVNVISVHIISPSEASKQECEVFNGIVDLSDHENLTIEDGKDMNVSSEVVVDTLEMNEPIVDEIKFAVLPEVVEEKRTNRPVEDTELRDFYDSSSESPCVVLQENKNLQKLLSPLSSEAASTSHGSIEEAEEGVALLPESPQELQSVTSPVLPKSKQRGKISDVAKMTVDKGRSLIKEMLQFCKCNEKIFQIAKLFVQQSADFIAKLILEHVVFDIHDTPTKGDYPREPHLTTIQRGLYKFIMALEKLEVRGVCQSYFKQADLYLRSIEDPVTLSPVTRLYVAICKGQFNYRQIRMAICSASADMGDLVLPYIYIILQMWIEVFPRKGISSHNHILMRGIVQIILTKNVSSPEYNLVNLRYLLFNYYHFSSDCEDSRTLLKEIIKYYIDERNECARVLAIALVKHVNVKILVDEIFPTLRAQGTELTDENRVCAVITMVMHLTKHSDLSAQIITENLQWLKQFGADLQPFVVKSHANSVLQWYMKCNFVPYTILEVT